MSKSNLEFMQINSDKRPFQTLDQKVDQAVLTLAYRQTKISLIASILCALVILVGLHAASGNLLLYSWFGFVVAVILLRGLLVSLYFREKLPLKNLSLWRNLFTTGACLGGMIWGLAGSFLFIHASTLEQMLIVYVLAGATAGAVPALAGVVLSGVGFLIFALVPLIIELVSVNTTTSGLLDVTLVAYLIYMVFLLFRTNTMLIQSIALQFENSALLNNLYNAKDQLETTNMKLEQAATHDPLTNAANRNLFNINFQVAIDHARDHEHMLALLYIDLDNFKEVNDKYGHPVGDQLLLGIINRLEEICKNNDNISRLGGDEFTIVLENIKHPSEAAKISRRVCQAIAQPLKINDLDICVSASVGISIYPRDGEGPEQLLQNADRSMYFVKQKGGNDFLFNGELFIN
jgi:diguanylate cyclase (GGDEF)-like protein